MNIFDDSWICIIHTIIWELKQVDQWMFHKIIYELYKEGKIPVNNWSWLGDWPRSPEIDGIIALLDMIGAVRIENGVIYAMKPPVIACVEDRELIEKAISISKKLVLAKSIGKK
ncbi:MAG: hypothetical protein DRO16_05545 [Thermoprotei archaeon]|nr:MAG: hypothetical protein DRO16_05545 [Thermoprotei archaeon]